jgi:hypothetical protein
MGESRYFGKHTVSFFTVEVPKFRHSLDYTGKLQVIIKAIPEPSAFTPSFSD